MVPFHPFLCGLSLALLTVTREAENTAWRKRSKIGGDAKRERNLKRGWLEDKNCLLGVRESLLFAPLFLPDKGKEQVYLLMLN